MDVTSMLEWLQRTSVAVSVRDSLFTFPVLESIHVVGLALVFGTIAILDLRLLGVASSERPVSRLMSDLLKWTWAAFAVTAVTGGLMFSTNAVVYFHNTFFRAKMILLLLAAVNMLVFELTARKTMPRWDHTRTTPPAAPSGSPPRARPCPPRRSPTSTSKICWACRSSRAWSVRAAHLVTDIATIPSQR